MSLSISVGRGSQALCCSRTSHTCHLVSRLHKNVRDAQLKVLKDEKFGVFFCYIDRIRCRIVAEHFM
jgi:hypothetical protein